MSDFIVIHFIDEAHALKFTQQYILNNPNAEGVTFTECDFTSSYPTPVYTAVYAGNWPNFHREPGADDPTEQQPADEAVDNPGLTIREQYDIISHAHAPAFNPNDIEPRHYDEGYAAGYTSGYLGNAHPLLAPNVDVGQYSFNLGYTVGHRVGDNNRKLGHTSQYGRSV